MSLTIGNAPFGDRPGVFNFTREGPAHVLYLEDSPRWVRGTLGDQTVVSSTRVRLLHETGLLPVYYFPLEDLSHDLLESSDHTTHCPFKGDARYWSIRVGDHVAENAVWHYPEPIEGAPPLAGLAAIYWRKLDHWYEEDEEVFVHARDPYHRVDVLKSSRHVRVELDGELLADSNDPVLLFETGLPTRYYLPRDDVRTELLTATKTHTECPYKGSASYWSVKAGDEEATDLVWCYEDPISAVEEIRGRLSFFNEKVDLVVDGERLERPRTKWS